jgi:hypothetical protein
MPSKFSRRLARRATRAMTSKRGNVTYYKGRGGRSEGVHTAKGALCSPLPFAMPSCFAAIDRRSSRRTPQASLWCCPSACCTLWRRTWRAARCVRATELLKLDRALLQCLCAKAFADVPLSHTSRSTAEAVRLQCRAAAAVGQEGARLAGAVGHGSPERRAD